MKVLLVDDEKLQLTRLESSVKKVLTDAELFCYTNPIAAIEENKNNKFDIAFLDIEMPKLNGVTLAKMLKGTNPLINIIFVTAYDKFALEAMRIRASGFVTKPVNEDKVREEIEALRYPIGMKQEKKIQIKCFGNFEVFHNGEPVQFLYRKSKELFAYLVDREGSAVNINELNAVLWEEDHKSYLRNLISDIQKTLKSLDASEVFIKKHNECYIDVNTIDCDAYEYKRNNPEAVRMYRGEYMEQYSWPMFNADDEY